MTSAAVTSLLRAGLALAICVAAGLPLVALAPRRLHRTLLPALPVAGVVTVVVLAHWLTLAAPYRWTAWLLVAAVVVADVVVLARPSLRPDVDRRTVLAAVVLLAAAMPGVAILASNARAETAAGLRFTSANHDAYYFSAVADWLVGNPNLAVPTIASTNRSPQGPAEDPARAYQSFKRWGEASVQGLPTALAGGRTSEHWALLTAGWLLLLPGAVFLLARGLGAGGTPALAAGVLAGLLVGGGGVLQYLVLNQNGAFVLGLPLLVAAGGALTSAVRAPERDRRAQAVAAVFLAGWLGTYFEYGILAVPFLLAAVLVVRPGGIARLARCLGAVAAATVVVGVLPLVNTLRGLLVVGGARPTWASYFGGDTPMEVIAKLVGQRSLDDLPVPPPGWWTGAALVLLAGWVLAVVAALWWRPTRWVLPPVAVVAAGYWYTQSRGDTNYIANRVVAMGLALVGVLAVVGAAAAVLAPARVARGTARSGEGDPAADPVADPGPDLRAPARPALAWGAGAVALLMVATGLVSSRTMVGDLTAWALPGRSLTVADREAAGWVREFGGADGARVAVATGDFVPQLLLLDQLRDLPDVGWPVLRPDYTDKWSFGSTEPPAYVLADRRSMVTGDLPELRSNDRWALYALQGTGAVVSPPAGMASVPGPPGSLRWTGPSATLGVVATATCGRVDLAVRSATAAAQPFAVRAGEALNRDRARRYTAGADPVTVPLAAAADGTSGVFLAAVPADAVLDLLVDDPPRCAGAAR
ncbi:MAG: hypothetical protein ACOYOP_04050 [Microthrixaceae bacterium]